MKTLSAVCVLLSIVSCSTISSKPKTSSTFDPKVNCTPKSLIYLDQTIQKNHRSVTEQIKAHQRYRNFIKTKLDAAQSCYVKDVQKSKDIESNYNVCMVVELNVDSDVSFLEIEDYSNPLPASVSKCLYDIFEVLDYKKVGGPGVFSQSFKFQSK